MQVPCWFYNFLKDEWHKTNEWDGLKFFYTQVLTGDAVDNIIGLYRVGPVKAKKMLAECKTEEELYKACVDAYDGDVDRVIENARLLWLRRYVDQLWEPPE
jgi:5'-3' exonuclease